MRILVDYRPALRERTGAGEYVHELLRAYAALPEARDDSVTVFTSSWKDRPRPGLEAAFRARVVDRRVPVSTLNYLWHRHGWPPVEWLAGEVDVAHAGHPLLIPTRRAAQVVTIHDLFFMAAPERTRAEIRRDYAELTPGHARQADAIITSSHHTAQLIVSRLGAEASRVYVCPPGAPTWASDAPGHPDRTPQDGTAMFIGTLEPRKNVGAILRAYNIILARGRIPPPLRLVGRATDEAAPWLDTISRPPLSDHVRHVGYVAEEDRERLYRTARLLILPSLDEGFGLPVLEAMSAGVPVIASNRGSLPEVLGGAGTLVEPDDYEGLADAILKYMDRDCAHAAIARGLARAREFSWARAAATARRAYADAMERRRQRRSN